MEEHQLAEALQVSFSHRNMDDNEAKLFIAPQPLTRSAHRKRVHKGYVAHYLHCCPQYLLSLVANLA